MSIIPAAPNSLPIGFPATALIRRQHLVPPMLSHKLLMLLTTLESPMCFPSEMTNLSALLRPPASKIFDEEGSCFPKPHWIRFESYDSRNSFSSFSGRLFTSMVRRRLFFATHHRLACAVVILPGFAPNSIAPRSPNVSFSSASLTPEA